MFDAAHCQDERRRIEAAAQTHPDRLEGMLGLRWAEEMIRAGCADNLARLIELGVDVNGIDTLRRTPLAWAAEHGSEACAERLLALGADPYAGDFTPVLVALNQGQDAIALKLLERAPPRSNAEETQWCMEAIRTGCDRTLRWFLAAGYPIDRRDEAGGTLLEWAAKTAGVPTLRVLLDHGATIDQPGYANRTPLMAAIHAGRNDNAHWLLDRGASPALATSAGTPLAMLASTLASEDVALVRRLLPHDRAHASHGASPLAAAAGGGHAEVVRLLLESGAPVEAVDGQGDTALHHACRRGQTHCARVLLDHGARTEIRNLHGETPLAAIGSGFRDRAACVHVLLERGADPRVATRQGWLPSQVAALEGEPAMVRALRHQAEARLAMAADPVDWEAHVRVADLVAALLARDATALDAWLETSTLAPDRLAAAIRPNPRRLLWLAVEVGSVPLTRLLLETGLDVDAADGDGHTPLHVAARRGRVDVAALLLDRGADIDRPNERGYPPIQLARDPAMIRLLRRRGARLPPT